MKLLPHIWVKDVPLAKHAHDEHLSKQARMILTNASNASRRRNCDGARNSMPENRPSPRTSLTISKREDFHAVASGRCRPQFSRVLQDSRFRARRASARPAHMARPFSLNVDV